MSAYEKVLLARAKDRPTGLSYIENIFEDFIELHGDRRFADDPAIVGGIATLKGQPVTVIAIDKGKDMRERVKRNFGSPNPEGYRKALRLMRQAEKFHRPVVCFVDTAGAFCGMGAEERGQGQAIAENLLEMSGLKTPIVSILVGEGGSGGALALAVADQVWILENAVYSVISPEGCASILWKDSKKVKDAADCLRLTAQDMADLGVVEQVFPEDKDFAETYRQIQEELERLLPELQALPVEELLEKRYQRFRKYSTQKPKGPLPGSFPAASLFSPQKSLSEKGAALWRGTIPTARAPAAPAAAAERAGPAKRPSHPERCPQPPARGRARPARCTASAAGASCKI